MAWAIGARCQAYSTIDGQWYLARVTGVSAAGQFVVQLEQGGPEEEVSPHTYRSVMLEEQQCVQRCSSS